jgi:long-chain fatty acid transport protein
LSHHKLRLLPAALLAAWAGSAGASGFQLLEQTASGIGNSFAGSAAVAENASTVYYNPAGMTQLPGRNVSVGVTAIDTSYKFSNGSSSVGSLATAGNGGDGGGLGYVPNGYMSWEVNKNVYLGLGIGAPFGLKTEYNAPWMGAAQSVKFEVKTINLNPSVAYRVNDTVSLGFGLDWQKLNAKYRRVVGTYYNVTPPYPVASTTGIDALLDVSDDAWGWNAGVLLNLSPDTKVGISYRSAVKYTATGNISLSSDGSALATGTMNTLNALYGASSNVKADIKLPDTLILSAAQKLDDRWEMLGDLSWTGWSSIPKIDIVRTSGVASGTVAQTLNTDFRDTWRVAVGANYKYTDTLKLKFGVAYDQTPVKGADTRLVSLPDNNRAWLSVGVQWLPAKGSTVDVGLAHLFVSDAAIHNDQRTVSSDPLVNLLASRGLVDGTYSDSAWLLGAQYSLSF